MLGLIDCNNFYVSCERVLDPSLNGKPVAVLSNNDGVIISRSQEVKALGIPMAAPVHQHKDVIKKHNVITISGNFSYYNTISKKVKAIVREYTPDVEDYSVDEVFICLSGRLFRSPLHQMKLLRAQIFDSTGIPVSIGIAKTKTLAKVATEFVKTHAEENAEGVMSLYEHPDIDSFLAEMEVGDVWGIGRQFSAFLKSNNVMTALDLKQQADLWVLKHLHIGGLRTVHELRGIPSIGFESIAAPPKQIMRSRSFGRKVKTLSELKEAAAVFTSVAAEALRAHGLAARNIGVFIMTNRFNNDPKYSNSTSRKLPESTSYTPSLIRHSHELLEQIFRDGYLYTKLGIVLTDLRPEQTRQLGFDHNEEEDAKQKVLMQTLDRMNEKYQSNFLLAVASQGIEHNWRSKQQKLTDTETIYNDPKDRTRFLTASSW